MCRKIAFLVVLSTLGLLYCTREKEPLSSGKEKPPSEGEQEGGFVTHPQITIPWPSLANSPCPTYLYDPQHTGRSAFVGPQEGILAGTIEYTLSDAHMQAVLGEDGTVYFTSPVGLIAANSDGSIKWKYDGCFWYTPLVTAEGTIYAYQARGGGICAFTPDGELKWAFKGDQAGIEWPHISALSKDGKTLYFAARLNTEDGTLHVYALTTEGNLKWKCKLEGRFAPEAAMSPDGTTLYVAVSKTGLYAVDTTGTVKWSYGYSDESSSPSVDNEGNIYFVTSGSVFSLQANGSLRWQTSIDAIAHIGPGVSIGWDGALHAVGQHATALYALDYDGKIMWKKENLWAYMEPVIDINGDIYISMVGGNNDVSSGGANFAVFHKDGTLKFSRSFYVTGARTIPDLDNVPVITSDRRAFVGTNFSYYFIVR